MARRNIAKEIEAGLREIASDLKGTGRKLKARTVTAPDVGKIRRRMGLSQAAFSVRFGLNPRTVQDWEQKRRAPDQPACVLLTVIQADPGAVEQALAGRGKAPKATTSRIRATPAAGRARHA
jgi:DNA-binding transcriptional regulator YiaG